MSGYRATPEEIGRLRREIREAVKMQAEKGYVPANTVMKAGTLDDHSWIHLRQRMRPAELAFLDHWCPRSTPAKDET